MILMPCFPGFRTEYPGGGIYRHQFEQLVGNTVMEVVFKWVILYFCKSEKIMITECWLCLVVMNHQKERPIYQKRSNAFNLWTFSFFCELFSSFLYILPFSCLDTDNNGYLDFKEFNQVISKICWKEWSNELCLTPPTLMNIATTRRSNCCQQRPQSRSCSGRSSSTTKTTLGWSTSRRCQISWRWSEQSHIGIWSSSGSHLYSTPPQNPRGIIIISNGQQQHLLAPSGALVVIMV